MICIGIESTAHTFGVGIVTEDKILANVKESYRPTTGGIHPREASDFLAGIASKVIDEAVTKAGIKYDDIDLVAFSRSPGIGHCLRVGSVAARTLSLELNKPLIGVNHCIAHVEIGRRMTGMNDPVVLYTSGANTQVIAYQGGKYRVFAETLDMGVGNFIDSFARLANIPFPGGPKIEQMALKGKYVQLPYVVKGMDISLTGILTNLKSKLSVNKIDDLCYSLQETVFAMLVEVSERALAHCQKKELLLAGGVAANKRLREMCKIMCDERDAKFDVPAMEYCVDNGAMIADLGLKMHKAGIKTPITIDQSQRTDEVSVLWR
ncbi:MAG TPA: bifunctional N(6)-L-threonylcarbamoyladenine synthase/serine/threonine protein kinase [Candidatus Nanoarchaeia archaeon]|nr:bifunctional N(6)-L-threonylcarbamoyladenine synthase/serine/threonine protein kinase [Candidatus Nanoarchaeia archaeon]